MNKEEKEEAEAKLKTDRRIKTKNKTEKKIKSTEMKNKIKQH
jgi:hypothetical protein